MTDFDKVINRRNSNSVKWASAYKNLAREEAAAEPLPMWVADMDFRSPEAVTQALQKAVRDEIFGYPLRSDSYDEAICGWQKRRFGWDVKPEWLVQTPGVVTALNKLIQTFSNEGDAVLVQPPVYGHFFSTVRGNGRQMIEAPLCEQERSYSFDPDRFEAAITPNTKIFILCNPHNPTGNVWSESDLRRMGEICLAHNILVISDEVHQDLILNKQVKHIPFASLAEEFAQISVTCTAPSKTFNMAGMQCSNLFIANPKIREEFKQALERDGLNFVNTLGSIACEAAYRHGEEWLDDLLGYIRGNQQHFSSAVEEHFPQLKVFKSDALYLAWMDCRGLGLDIDALDKFLLTKARVWFDRGPKFGSQGHGFMRVNLGCPRATVDEALARMKSALI
ncbi:MalY/PatB family protein [Paenochrobactrum glaciei]|uniref:cysteine-S-conjugate beta-lyase n=1 Tax=Paenochrobactrum glaciei TaxID=486407 RepID=A0ABN1G8L0_9HYPH